MFPDGTSLTEVKGSGENHNHEMMMEVELIPSWHGKEKKERKKDDKPHPIMPWGGCWILG